ncbi:hypothetical protein ACVWYF_004142 [Hymenobacter sp. UYAg731]
MKTFLSICLLLASCEQSPQSHPSKPLGEHPVEPVAQAGVPATSPQDNIPAPEIAVRSYLRNTLNDWDSYQSIEYGAPAYASPPTGSNSYAWRVRHRYRAKNSFGAYVLKEQFFYYTTAGVFDVEEGLE